MKKLFMCFTLIGALTLPAFASVTANVSFASDYIWRGMTQTGDDPAISGGFDYEADSGFYAGIWGSNVNFSSGAGSELDFYFGYALETDFGLGVDISYVDFMYPGDSALDFQELGVGLSYEGFGFGYYAGQDGAADYMDFSYELGAISLSYGDYDGVGSNFLVSYGFDCGEYYCSLAYSDFSNDGSYGETIGEDGLGLGDGMDEDALVFSVSASF